MVAALSRAALAVGAHGIIVEVHHDPDRALSDGPQSLRPEAFAEMMGGLARIAAAMGVRMTRLPRGHRSH
jgi:3-deoxy-7-phosphoheptulonate synthase